MDLLAREKLGLLRQPSFLGGSIWETPPKMERKNPKGEGVSEKTSQCKKGICFRADHKQVFSLTPERYQVVLCHGSNPGLITAPLKPVSDHISLTVMLWECVMTGMQYCCCTHAVAHRFIFLCAGLCAVVFILTCMTFKKKRPPLWEERLPCCFVGVFSMPDLLIALVLPLHRRQLMQKGFKSGYPRLPENVPA